MTRTPTDRTRTDGNGTRRTDDAALLAAAPARRGGAEARIGAFLIAGIVAVVVALFLLTDPSLFRGRYSVSTVVPNAGGIRSGDPVQLRGVNVGRVRAFGITGQGVRIRMELEGEYEVPEDSRVVLRSGGLLGGMIAEIVPGSSPDALEGGDMLPGTSESGLAGLTESAEGIAVRTDTVLGRVQSLLNPGTIGAVGSSAEELQGLLTELSALAAEQRGELAALSTSLRRSAQGVEGATSGPELQRAVARVDSLTGELNQSSTRLARASGSLETVLGRLERGEGTLGRLSTDEALYENLNRAAQNAGALVEDIRENPKRYLSVRVF